MVISKDFNKGKLINIINIMILTFIYYKINLKLIVYLYDNKIIYCMENIIKKIKYFNI